LIATVTSYASNDAEMIRYKLHPAVDRNANHWSRIAIEVV